MQIGDIEHHLRKRFMYSNVDVLVREERLSTGRNALAIRWMRPSRDEKGCLFMAADSPIDEIVLDLEAELTRKERGA